MTHEFMCKVLQSKLDAPCTAIVQDEPLGDMAADALCMCIMIALLESGCHPTGLQTTWPEQEQDTRAREAVDSMDSSQWTAVSTSNQ